MNMQRMGASSQHLLTAPTSWQTILVSGAGFSIMTEAPNLNLPNPNLAISKSVQDNRMLRSLSSSLVTHCSFPMQSSVSNPVSFDHPGVINIEPIDDPSETNHDLDSCHRSSGALGPLSCHGNLDHVVAQQHNLREQNIQECSAYLNHPGMLSTLSEVEPDSVKGDRASTSSYIHVPESPVKKDKTHFPQECRSAIPGTPPNIVSILSPAQNTESRTAYSSTGTSLSQGRNVTERTTLQHASQFSPHFANIPDHLEGLCYMKQERVEREINMGDFETSGSERHRPTQECPVKEAKLYMNHIPITYFSSGPKNDSLLDKYHDPLSTVVRSSCDALVDTDLTGYAFSQFQYTKGPHNVNAQENVADAFSDVVIIPTESDFTCNSLCLLSPLQNMPPGITNATPSTDSRVHPLSTDSKDSSAYINQKSQNDECDLPHASPPAGEETSQWCDTGRDSSPNSGVPTPKVCPIVGNTERGQEVDLCSQGLQPASQVNNSLQESNPRALLNTRSDICPAKEISEIQDFLTCCHCDHIVLSESALEHHIAQNHGGQLTPCRDKKRHSKKGPKTCRTQGVSRTSRCSSKDKGDLPKSNCEFEIVKHKELQMNHHKRKAITMGATDDQEDEYTAVTDPGCKKLQLEHKSARKIDLEGRTKHKSSKVGQSSKGNNSDSENILKDNNRFKPRQFNFDYKTLAARNGLPDPTIVIKKQTQKTKMTECPYCLKFYSTLTYRKHMFKHRNQPMSNQIKF